MGGSSYGLLALAMVARLRDAVRSGEMRPRFMLCDAQSAMFVVELVIGPHRIIVDERVLLSNFPLWTMASHILGVRDAA
jgi:hypothetical protein